MKSYLLTEIQAAAQRYTHLARLGPADFAAGFAAKQIVLYNLVKGDAVLRAMIEVRSLLAGPTPSPTGQVRIFTAAIAVTPLVVLTTADLITVTAGTSGAAGAVSAADTLVLDLQLGGGGVGAVTAGDIWVWFELSRRQNRNVEA